MQGSCMHSVSLEIDNVDALYRAKDKLERVLELGGSDPMRQCRVVSGISELGRGCLSDAFATKLEISIAGGTVDIRLRVDSNEPVLAARRRRGARYFELEETGSGLTFSASVTCPRFHGTAGERMRRQAADILEEITEAETRRLLLQKEAAEAVADIQGDFLRRMSHELRTPLTTVIGYAEMLAESSFPEEQRDTLDLIRRESKHVLRVIDDILEFRDLKQDRATPENVTVRVQEFVESIVNDVGRPIREKGNRISVDCSTAPPEIVTDERKLGVILSHLLENASKFTENGSVTLTVSARTLEDRPGVLFEVHDTGVGIDRSYLGRLFDAFSQMDESSTRRFEGLGLGLAISQGYAALLGGTIAVDSEQGSTTMSLWLPLQR